MNYPCDVELIAHHHRCAGTPARAFTAYCACGCKISGHICEMCSQMRLPGCLTCWKDGAGHQCPVEFDSAECLCGCGAPVGIAARTQTRDRMIRGRPLRYIQGHGRRDVLMREREALALAAAKGGA